MSLSARIVVGPSIRLASTTAALAIGGIAATAATVAMRWPAALTATFVGAGVLTVAIVARAVTGYRAAGPRGVVVSARPDVDVRAVDDLDGAWRLAAPTMCWTGADGFSVVGLVRADVATDRVRTTALPILHADLAAADTRALGRFLLWSLRGGPAEPMGETVRRTP